MRRLAFCTVATIMVVTAMPSSACMPSPIQFGLGSARLDARARRAIDEVVHEFRTQRGARLRLTAQTDGVGPADANMQLARRRGEAVKTALVRRGIPASAIDVIAEGEGGRRGSLPGQRIVWPVVVAAPALDTAGESAC
jgi:outer membrane protein OmpA-like peptidoglycan-associated protein